MALYGSLALVFSRRWWLGREDWTAFFALGMALMAVSLLGALGFMPAPVDVHFNLLRVMSVGLAMWAFSSGVPRFVRFGSPWMRRMFSWTTFAITAVALLAKFDEGIGWGGSLFILACYGLPWAGFFAWALRRRAGWGLGLALAGAFAMTVACALSALGRLPAPFDTLPGVLPLCAMSLGVLWADRRRRQAA